MKKLNRKGFTLIELLAVIVILAIILVAVVPAFMGVIDDAKVSSISNLSKSVAESYNGSLAQDLLSPGKIFHGIVVSEDWQCIGDLTASEGEGLNKVTYNLADILELSDTDLHLKVITSNPVATTDVHKPAVGVDGELTRDSSTGKLNVDSQTCSAIRKKPNGSAEVLLVAKPKGNFDVTNKVVYALSSEDNGIVK